MRPDVILAGIYLPLFGLTIWFHIRLRQAIAERHPMALRLIDSMTRALPREQRALERHSRYRMLQDPEIDRHLRNWNRMQILLQYAVLAFALVLVFVVVSAAFR